MRVKNTLANRLRVFQTQFSKVGFANQVLQIQFCKTGFADSRLSEALTLPSL
jgi:hypothetical protein